MERAEIQSKIDEERDRQDEKWGGYEHDARHTFDEWMHILDKRMVRIAQAKTPAEKGQKIIELCAVGFAMLEAGNFDAPEQALPGREC